MTSNNQNIDQLNQDFGIPGKVEFKSGHHGMPFIKIDSGFATAIVSLYAGQVLSFQPYHEVEDLLFASEKAFFEPGKSIKGGIPICWPWFGPDPLQAGRPSHGFARQSQWQMQGSEHTLNDEIKLTLELVKDSDNTSMWPDNVQLMLCITIGRCLSLELVTHNLGNKKITITQAFHSYFNVGNIEKVKVIGLEESHYIDKVHNDVLRTQKGAVTISEEVDRIYTDVPQTLVIDDKSLQRQIQINSTGNRSAVVWNPWKDISIAMADLDDHDYRKFICVETTNAADDCVELDPGDEHHLCVSYRSKKQDEI